MMEEISLQSIFVNEVSTDMLKTILAELQKRATSYSDDFATLKSRAFHDYIEALNRVHFDKNAEILC